MNSHRVVGLQYSGGEPHLKVACYRHSFSQTNRESLDFIRCILVGNWQSGERLNFDSFISYCKYLWHVNGIDWDVQTSRQRVHLRSLRVKFSGNVGDYVGVRLFPCVRTNVMRLPDWLSLDVFSVVLSDKSESEHELIDDSTSACSELSEQSVYT